MNKNLVINASSIILLGKADLLKTISPLAKTWIIPDGVIHEVQAKRPIDPFLKRPGASELAQRIQHSQCPQNS